MAFKLGWWMSWDDGQGSEIGSRLAQANTFVLSPESASHLAKKDKLIGNCDLPTAAEPIPDVSQAPLPALFYIYENLLNLFSRIALYLSKYVQEVWSVYPCPPYVFPPVKQDSLIAIGASWSTISTIAHEPKRMVFGYDLDVVVIGSTT